MNWKRIRKLFIPRDLVETYIHLHGLDVQIDFVVIWHFVFSFYYLLDNQKH